MEQIKISELPVTTSSSGSVPIVQDGETKQFDLSPLDNKLDLSGGTMTGELYQYPEDIYYHAGNLNSAAITAALGDRTPLSFYKTNDTFAPVATLCAGYITNESKSIVFFIPSTRITGTWNCSSLSICTRFAQGGYGWARSGASGGNYNQLGASVLSIYSNGQSVRTNEVDSVEVTAKSSQGMDIRVNFKYPIVTANNGTTAMTNNSTVSVIVSGTFTKTA